MLCFAAKWLDGKSTMFWSKHHDGEEAMVQNAWNLLDQADVVMHYNGKRFDNPHLNREFVLHGMQPPAPYQQIDLLTAVKKQFKFPSYKLEYVLTALGLQGKVKHQGHELWIKCMAGDEKAWRQMRLYNKRDVRALEDLYYRIRAWVPNHPNAGLFLEDPDAGQVCPGCGGTNVTMQGHRYTSIGKYQRFQCQDCYKWSSSGRREVGADLREVRL